MAKTDPARRSAQWREGLLFACFLLLVVAGIVTVVMPELSKSPEAEGRPASATKPAAPPPAPPAAK